MTIFIVRHYKKLVDYLFYVWNPKSGAASQEFHTILVNGFPKSRNEDVRLCFTFEITSIFIGLKLLVIEATVTGHAVLWKRSSFDELVWYDCTSQFEL